MTATQERTDQLAFWNGAAGRNWTELQETLDETFRPISLLLLKRAAAKDGERVIDVGCGCGESSIELAAAVGTAGEVTGVDISADMLARARQRSPARTPARFLRADATSHVFKAERADLIYSRFGVMFFERPDAAFANLFRALRRGGRLAFACWREPKLNPWLMLPLREAYKHVPPLPPLGPEDPGPFSFMSEERVRRILSGAGFASIEMLPVDLSLDVAANQGIDHAVRMALSIGPASRALEGQSHGKIDEVEQAIRAAMAEHVQGDSVMLPAAVWIVSASKQ